MNNLTSLTNNNDRTIYLKKYTDKNVLMYIYNDFMKRKIINELQVNEFYSPNKVKVLENWLGERYAILVYSIDKWKDLINFFEVSITYEDISKETFSEKGLKNNRIFSFSL